MKNLQLDAADLRKIFEHSITVRDISSKFSYHSGDEDSKKLKIEMIISDYDVMGVQNGESTGYVFRDDLRTGSISDFMKQFQPSELISETTPLIDLFPILKNRERVFVLTKNKIDCIVTRSDLQKAPVRMLIFGFISILEMHLLQIIKRIYPDGSWKNFLKRNRFNEAKKTYDLRHAKNEALDLIDCIQLADKRDLLINNVDILKKIGFNSKTTAEKFLKKVEGLRNKLAHAQEIDSGSSWPEIIELTVKVESIIKKIENLESVTLR